MISSQTSQVRLYAEKKKIRRLGEEQGIWIKEEESQKNTQSQLANGWNQDSLSKKMRIFTPEDMSPETRVWA